MKISTYLNESLRTAREKYGSHPDFNELVQLDPTTPTKYKYIEWMAKMVYEDPDKPEKEKVADYVKKFDILVNRNKIQPNAIELYKNFEDLKKKVDERAAGITLDKSEKELKYDVERVEPGNANVVIVSPNNHRASNHFGFGATWCTAASNDNYWKRYIDDDEGKLYYIRKKNWGGPDLIPTWEREKRQPYGSEDRLRNTAVLVQRNGERSFWDYFDRNITEQFKPFLKEVGLDIKVFKPAPFGARPGKDYELIWSNATVSVYISKSQDFVAKYIDGFFEKVYGKDWGQHWHNRTRSGDERKFFEVYRPYIVTVGEEAHMYLIKEGYDYIDIYDKDANVLSPEAKKAYMDKLKQLGVPKVALRSTRSIKIKETRDFKRKHANEANLIFENDKCMIVQPLTFEAFQLYGTKSWYSSRRGRIVRDEFDFGLKLDAGERIFIVSLKVNGVLPPIKESERYCIGIKVPHSKEDETNYWYTGVFWEIQATKMEWHGKDWQTEMKLKFKSLGIPDKIYEYPEEDLFWYGIMSGFYSTAKKATESGKVDVNMRRDGKTIGETLMDKIKTFQNSRMMPISDKWIDLYNANGIKWNTIDKDGNNLLMRAIKEEMIGKLGPGFGSGYYTPSERQMPPIKFIKAMDPNQTDKDGNTVLHLLTRRSGHEIKNAIKILVETWGSSSIDLKKKGAEGKTAYELAMAKRETESWGREYYDAFLPLISPSIYESPKTLADVFKVI